MPLAMQNQALIIGVSRYTHFADLLDTGTDATAVAEVLKDPRYGGYSPDRVDVLAGETVTCDAILDGLRTLARYASADATTVFYFSGHGGYINSNPGMIYLCGSDADPRDFPGTALSSDLLSSALAAIHTQRLLVILDACHAAGAVALKSPPPNIAWREEPPPQFYQELGAGSGHIVLASSRRDQTSQMYPPGHMSLFTYYLIEGLKGRAHPGSDGSIHVFELFEYVSGAMRQTSPNQTPILAAKDVDTNFPVVAYRGQGRDGHITPTAPSSIAEIRERIVQRPRDGAKALVAFLRMLPYELLEQATIEVTTVETNLSELLRIEDRMRAFTETSDLKGARMQIIDYLLTICTKWERIERR